MNNDTHTSTKVRVEHRNEWWRDDKRSGKERKGRGGLVFTVTQQPFSQVCVWVCMKERERHRMGLRVSEPVCKWTCVCVRVCFWPKPAGFSAVSWSCAVLADKAMLTNSKYCYLHSFSFSSNSFLLFVSCPLIVWLQSPSPILFLCLYCLSPFWIWVSILF